MIIRCARGDEADALTELAIRSKASWGYDATFMRACLPALLITREIIARDPVFVAIDADRALMGFATLQRRGEDLELGHLFVDPDYHGYGAGRALLTHALGEAVARGWSRIVVESDPGAEPFYLRFGARRIGEVISPVTGRALPFLEIGVGEAKG